MYVEPADDLGGAARRGRGRIPQREASRRRRDPRDSRRSGPSAAPASWAR
jgi:hypothetical protein